MEEQKNRLVEEQKNGLVEEQKNGQVKELTKERKGKNKRTNRWITAERTFGRTIEQAEELKNGLIDVQKIELTERSGRKNNRSSIGTEEQRNEGGAVE